MVVAIIFIYNFTTVGIVGGKCFLIKFFNVFIIF